MKTAISVPDETFSAVDQRARDLGISRSEFFTVAARRYLHALDERSITVQIDAVLEAIDGSDDSNALAAAAGRRRLAGIDDGW